jgi:hypothetical protein
LPFDLEAYGSQVAQILALDQEGQRLIPLVSSGCSSREARSLLQKQKPLDLFANARAPQAALGGLFLYFSCSEECHEIVQDLDSPEGSFWHAILHRQEPDAGNAAYWFRRAGTHPVFGALVQAAEDVVARYPQAEFRPGAKWDPFSFIDFAEQARRNPKSPSERAAVEIQRAEWQLLFDYCARTSP